MSKSKKLVFFGNERLATGSSSSNTPTLKALLSEGYDVAAIVANYSEGTSRNARQLEIAEVAKRYNIPLLLPSSPLAIREQLLGYGAEAAVLVAYGRIIPGSIIDLFPQGIINIHPSLLPLYRGPTPIETVILDGTTETGVSIMKLSQKMDEGSIFGQARISLRGNETKQELADKLSRLGAETLLKLLPAILDGTAQPKPQNHKKATYTRLLKKEDSWLDSKLPAEVLERQTRAYLGFPKSRIKLFDKHEVVVNGAGVVKSQDNGALVIKCQPGYLEITELIAPSGRTMSGADFLRGYKS